MRRHLIALPAFTVLAACSPSAPPAPAIPPTELTAVRTPPPDYPVELACAGIGGTTTLSVTIGPGPHPENLVLVRGSGNAVLDASAQQAVKDWEFKPATRNGQPVPKTIQIPVNFNPPQERPAECFRYDEKG